MGQIASRGQLRMAWLRWALVIVPLILLLGIGSGRLADASYGNPWFDGLDKPALMPPGWAFGVAWTILYVITGLALSLIIAARGARGRGAAIALFIVQLVMNLAWAPLFFGAHRMHLALGLIVALFVVTAFTTATFWRIRRSAGLLILPYLAWLIFASLLNYQILALNPDAESLAPAHARTQISL